MVLCWILWSGGKKRELEAVWRERERERERKKERKEKHLFAIRQSHNLQGSYGR